MVVVVVVVVTTVRVLVGAKVNWAMDGRVWRLIVGRVEEAMFEGQALVVMVAVAGWCFVTGFGCNLIDGRLFIRASFTAGREE